MDDRRSEIVGMDISSPSSSPFHPGEHALQTHLSVRDRVEALGKRVIRDHLTEEHRAFFTQLPYLPVGSRDASGRLWASFLQASEGFISSPDPQHLVINARPVAGDPLEANISSAAKLGLLGIQLHTRRRNRVNGRVVEKHPEGFVLEVDQTFGNCPKYIQTREIEQLARQPGSPSRYNELNDEDRKLISVADTFFIATGIEGDVSDPRVGQDISHRGGRPGFVKAEGNVITWPDFVGNYHFNTLGNLVVDPRAGLLFIDFESGDSLQITGKATVLWDAPEQAEFQGAERFVRFEAEEVIRIPEAVSLGWDFTGESPFNRRTGVWGQES